MSNNLENPFRGGPAFFAGETSKGNPDVPEGYIRIHCLRLESYQMDQQSEEAWTIRFQHLMDQARQDPAVAKLLLLLNKHLTEQRKELISLVREGNETS